MIQVRCDRAGCGATALTDGPYNIPPKGWVNLRIIPAPYKDYCSAVCAATDLTDRAEPVTAFTRPFEASMPAPPLDPRD